MSQPATSDVPDAVKAVRELILMFKDVKVPEGKVRKHMEPALHHDKQGAVVDHGLHVLLESLGNMLTEIPVEHPQLIARLLAQDGTNITNLLNDIATNPPNLQAYMQELRAALTVEGKPLLELVKGHIAATGKHPPGSDTSGAQAEPQKPGADGAGGADDAVGGLRKRRGWAQGGAGPVDEEAIKRSARGWDKSHGGGHDREIHGEADEYDREHGLDKKHRREIHDEAKEYDREHPVDDKYIHRMADKGYGEEGYQASRPGPKERAAYLELAERLAAAFEEKLGARMGMAGGRRPG